MKNRGITLVSLVVTIIILIILAGISLNLVLGENGLFQMAKKAKENMELAQTEEQEQLNALYTQLESEVSGDGSEDGGTSYDIIGKLVEFKKAIADYIEEAGGEKPEYTAEKEEYGEAIKGIVANVTKDATVTKEQILTGQTAWVKGQLLIGTMANNGAVNKTLKAGESYTIAEGYHDGNGSITVSGLTEQTTGDAKAAEILAGKIAWVNGERVTGSMKNNGALNPKALNAGESYPIPEGYTSGGTVTTNSLESQTPGDAAEEDIAEGKTAWVNGVKLIGNAVTR